MKRETEDKKINYHGKEVKPMDTVNRIRKILDSLGLTVIEKLWRNNVNKLYSVMLCVNGYTFFSTNGKGVSREYALASAYGEFIERLQNNQLWPIEIKLKNGRYGHYYPDKVNNKDGFIDLPSCFKKGKVKKSNFSVYDVWNENKKNLNEKNITYVPFFNLNKRDVDYLPINYITSIYGSNGMCAGNNPEEAICQGICEILERYVGRQIYYNQITPTTITMEYIQKHSSKNYEIIEDLKKNYNMKIMVKDCSLNKGLPVVGIIFIFSDNNKYKFKLGSHPIWQIALERCLTEVFQGVDIDEKFNAVEFNIQTKEFETNNLEFKKGLRDGTGTFPIDIFKSKFNYQFNEFDSRESFSQKENLDNLVFLINKKLEYNIFIRDTSYTGFNSYYIIIPGISEYKELTSNSKDFFKKNFKYFNRKKYFSKLENLNHQELNELAKNMVESSMNKSVDNFSYLTLADYLNLPVLIDNPWKIITLDMVLAVIYYKIDDIKKAYKCICDFVDYLEEKEYDKGINYYYTVKNYFALLTRYNKKEANQILEKISDRKNAKKVIKGFKNKDKLFEKFLLPNYRECNKCNAKSTCKYKEIKKLYDKYIYYIKDNNVSQKNLHNIIFNNNRVCVYE